MKRRTNSKSASVQANVNPDIIGLINSMRQQLTSLEIKIDSLIGRSQPKPPEIKTFPNNLQFTPRPQNIPNPKQDNRPRERILHKAVCADCKKECEVPFKPSGDRPVYCKDCFSKRKTATTFNARPDNRPMEPRPLQTPPEKKPPAEHKKSGEKRSAEKKKPLPKKRKARR